MEALVKDTGPANSITVLVVSPCPGDLALLKAMLKDTRYEWSGARSRYTLKAVSRIPSAVYVLQQTPTAVVLCDSELLAGSWTELLGHISTLPDSPYVIVTSRLADERLWIKALNLGAYDVLAKPFEAVEVVRSVTRACGHWKDRIEAQSAGTANKKVAAA